MKFFKKIWKSIDNNIEFRVFSGLILLITGVLFGIYVGIWVCFIGGMVAFIEAFQADPIIPLEVALSFARIWFSALIGYLAGAIFIWPGIKLIN